MVSVVVADAGPLIALGRVDRIDLLAVVFQQTQVPQAVLAECLVQSQRPDARRIEAALSNGWLLPCEAIAIDAPGLGLGERAAIGRAQAIGAALLADDQAARACAVRLGLVTVGTLGVLVKAHRLGLVPELRALIEQLRGSGYWLGDATIEQALAAAKAKSDR
jgi:predicted nucleic acid-binding protein